jgi:threonine synthase
MHAVIFCPAGLEPEKMAATTVYGARVYAVRGSYDDCSRLISEFAGEVDDWGIVNVNLRSYYAEGSKTLAFEIVEQLGWEVPTAVVAPIASGAMFSKLWQGFEQFGRIGLIDDRRPRLYGGQAEGCAPVAAAFWEERRVSPVRPNSIAKSLAIGNPADGDLAIATARRSGGAIHAVAEDEIGQNMALLAETAGIFGETATGVTVGALRAAAARGEIGENDRVVVLVTGTGLKTPQAVEEEAAGSLVEIDADLEVLLEELGVPA